MTHDQDQPKHVLVAERHPDVRRALRAAIGSRFVCDEASTALDVLERSRERAPDVVLLDACLPAFDNLEFTTQLTRLVDDVKIVVLGVYESTELARRFREAGAHGYLLKTDAGVVIVDAIQAVIAGGVFFQDRMLAISTELSSEPLLGNVSAQRALTPREREVVLQLAEGRSNKEIACTLDISVNTVETHRARIMSKLELHSIGELVRYAIRNLLITP